MRWIEIVRVRSAGGDIGTVETFLRSLDGIKQEGLLDIRSYRHASLDTDLAVHLVWETSQIDEQGSALGLRLAQTLGAFGLVDHSLWCDADRYNKDGERGR